MMPLRIAPLLGVDSITFGMSRIEVRDCLGPVVAVREKFDLFRGGYVHVHYDARATVALIVLANGGEVGAMYAGVDLFALTADEAIAFVSRDHSPNSAEPGYPMSVTFPAIELNLWRSALPEHDPATKPGLRFESVGVGRKGYFSGTGSNVH